MGLLGGAHHGEGLHQPVTQSEQAGGAGGDQGEGTAPEEQKIDDKLKILAPIENKNLNLQFFLQFFAQNTYFILPIFANCPPVDPERVDDGPVEVVEAEGEQDQDSAMVSEDVKMVDCC